MYMEMNCAYCIIYNYVGYIVCNIYKNICSNDMVDEEQRQIQENDESSSSEESG